MALTREQAVREQRNLAKLANFADSMVRVPFTTVGVGADSAVGAVPVLGDLIGLVIFSYIFGKAKQLELPKDKVFTLIAYAGADAFVGFIPGLGDVVDIFSRPNRHALRLVTKHLRDTHQISDEVHINKPWLDGFLDDRASSRFWSQPAVKWFVLHLPDLIVLAFLIIFFNSLIQLIGSIGAWLSHPFG